MSTLPLSVNSNKIPDNIGSENEGSKTMSFNKTFLGAYNVKVNDQDKNLIGKLVDDGAQYSAIGNIELLLLKDHLNSVDDIDIDPIPESLNGFTHW